MRYFKDTDSLVCLATVSITTGAVVDSKDTGQKAYQAVAAHGLGVSIANRYGGCAAGRGCRKSHRPNTGREGEDCKEVGVLHSGGFSREDGVVLR